MAAARAPLVVVTGVAGTGKTTVGRLLARRLHAEFLEGDDLQPERNLERRAVGIALTDHDLRHWLRGIAEQLADARAGRHALVVACAATRRHHRDLLRAAASELAFVHLQAEAPLLLQRLRDARGHAATERVATELASLEPPGADERTLTLQAALPAEELAAQAAAWLTAAPAAAARRR